MTKQEFKELVAKGKVVLDGATGSNLMKAGMPRGVCSEAWIYENPQALIELQKAYAEAGSDIIYAPTFSANRISLANHGLEDKVEELSRTRKDYKGCSGRQMSCSRRCDNDRKAGNCL